MAEKVTACLIGPSRGGKSSLLASWIQCAILRFDGYPLTTSITARLIDEADFEAAGTQVSSQILKTRGQEFKSLENSFLKQSKFTATDQNQTFQYFFLVGHGAPGGASPRQIYLEIVDAAGEYTAPAGEEAAEQFSEQVVEKFGNKIRQADAVIVVIPLLKFDNAPWVRAIVDNLQALLDSPGKLRRIVIVFTQYERLFVRFGSSAFQFAARRPVARFVVQRFLQRAPWLKQLHTFETDDDERKVRFIVTSAFGFVDGHGNPNLDPYCDPNGKEMPFLNGEKIDKELWRPFLTADPFIFAATGEESRFTFPYRFVDPSRPIAEQGEAHDVASGSAAAGQAAESNGEPQSSAQVEDEEASFWTRLRGYFE